MLARKPEKYLLTYEYRYAYNFSGFGLRHNYSPKFFLKNYCTPALSHWSAIGFWNDGTGLLW